MNIFRVFLESSLAAQLIMVVLVIFSIWSWALFLKKLFDLSGVRKRGRAFLAAFRFYRSVKELDNLGRQLEDNPYGRTLKAGFGEYQAIRAGIAANPRLAEIADNMKLAMDRARAEEVKQFESGLPAMATIVTISPFLGLLGTVWGIMEAFLEVRARGSAHITVVAPGISDALITTVYGLLVAIPALIFNNLLRSRINDLDSDVEQFSSEVFARLKKALLETE